MWHTCTRVVGVRVEVDAALTWCYTQDELKGGHEHWNWLTPRPGGAAMPFAWDEPLAPHKLRVHVRPLSRPSWIALRCASQQGWITLRGVWCSE